MIIDYTFSTIDRCAYVGKIQARLAELGYYGAAIDNWYGTKTKTAVEQYQKSVGLKISGMVDKATQAALGLPQPTLSDACGKVGVRGGHGDGANVIPAKWQEYFGLPYYSEGTTNRKLAIALNQALGWFNARPDAGDIAFSEAARRLSGAGCNTALFLHTNWSMGKTEPNHGSGVMFVSIFREQSRPIAEKIAQMIVDAMPTVQSVRVTTRPSQVGNWDYYGAIRNAYNMGITHPIIIEFGYHIDMARDVDGNIARIVAGFERLFMEKKVHRLAGATRYETAKLANEYNGDAGVVIASGEAFADCSVGAVLATRLNVPLVLTPNTYLDQYARQSIVASQAKFAVLVGGTATINQSVEDQIEAIL